MDLERIAEQLQVSLVEVARGSRARGRQVGLSWATEDATKRQLKRLADYVEEMGYADNAVAYHSGNQQTGAEVNLFYAINGRKEDYSDGGFDFWESVAGGDTGDDPGEDVIANDSEFAAGFVEACCKVWEQVKVNCNP